MAHAVFISYSANDTKVADVVCSVLESRGIRCWIAPRDILPGQHYGEAIIDAIGATQVMVLILSSNANASTQVLREVERTASRDIPIIPLRVEDSPLAKSLEYFISSHHWLDATKRPLEACLEQLADTVERVVSPSRNQLYTKTTEDVYIGEGKNAGIAMPPIPSRRAPTPTSLPTPRGISLDLPFNKVSKQPGLLVNSNLSKYVILEFLGAGGTGLVFRSLDNELAREVCIKVFYPLVSDIEDIAAMVSRELRGVAALTHPNLIKVFEFGQMYFQKSSSFYLVTEYVHGEPLNRWYLRLPDDETSLPKRLRMAYDITIALSAAHNCRYIDQTGLERQGVLHGDIKPSNILIRTDNSPVVLDFMLPDVQQSIDLDQGATRNLFAEAKNEQDLIARMGFPSSMRTRLTRILQGDFDSPTQYEPITEFFGTPGFMAPEQETGGIITIKSDIFSLGMTLCLLFYPRGPEQGSFLAELRKRGDSRFVDLSKLLVDMLRPDAALRPKDMSEVADCLVQAASKMGVKLP